MEQGTLNQRQDYWVIELQKWGDSGVSGLQYCKDNHLSYSRFIYWRKKLDIQCESASGNRPPSKSRFAKVIANPAQEASPISDGGLTMVLPNGITLQGIRGEHVKLVGQLLRQL